MIIHNFDPVLIDLGFFQIRWYSIAYILGIIIGWIYAIKIIGITSNNRYNFQPIKTSDFDNCIIYLVFGIIIGGRLGYVVFYNLDYFIQNFSKIFSPIPRLQPVIIAVFFFKSIILQNLLLKIFL